MSRCGPSWTSLREGGRVPTNSSNTKARAIPGKVRSGFPSGIAEKQVPPTPRITHAGPAPARPHETRGRATSFTPSGSGAWP
ncbi:hypothetical protein GHK33_15030 [Sinorhizobium meliloti]|nr:hypothetical protein [Sinorhizobium meliloti]MDW9696618.1 hypothetical protein [Sinorhizobium meliloti]MDW9734886.1 hypothetical protein [Sinorhizobium meliloti]MDW9773174.1 hypothetical protein [Sinorhizobium meliloti]MDW9847879.1 hypothetical protein [Sinorhizobium meliloti]